MNFEMTSDMARQRDVFEVTGSSLTGDCRVPCVRRVKRVVRVVGEWEVRAPYWYVGQATCYAFIGLPFGSF